jgi:hypothetical protein
MKRDKEGEYVGFVLYICMKIEQWNLIEIALRRRGGGWRIKMKGVNLTKNIVSIYVNATVKPPWSTNTCW